MVGQWPLEPLILVRIQAPEFLQIYPVARERQDLSLLYHRVIIEELRRINLSCLIFDKSG